MIMVDQQAELAKGVEKAEKFSEASSMATLKRMESMRPTPTQHECNLAAVGALDPSKPKEDDGSGPELVQVRTIVPVNELDDMGRYQTRAMGAQAGSGSSPPRSAQQAAQAKPPQG
jgi:hypothetical protein